MRTEIDVFTGGVVALPDVVVTIDPAEIAFRCEAKKDLIRAVRERILAAILGIKDEARDVGDTATVAACRVVRLGLLDITKDLPIDPDQIDDAVMLRYAALVGQCTPQMVSAFREVVL